METGAVVKVPLFVEEGEVLRIDTRTGRICVTRKRINSTMSWKPQATKQALVARARLNASIRSFFQQRNIIEVETPLLNPYAVTDLHIDSIATQG